MRYFVGLFRSVFVGHNIWWWLSLALATVFGGLAIADYDRYRDGINGLVGRPLMPPSLPFSWVVLAFVLWLVASLGHREAMRYWRAARIVAGKPYGISTPLYRTVRVNGAPVQAEIQSYLTMVKVDISNNPFKPDEGKDITDAWGEVELFDLDSKPVTKWLYPRWEENKQPGYGDHPLDHFPDQENMRTLVANGRPHILCIAIKHVGDDFAYPIRGADQLREDWRSTDIKIPRGNYLLRLKVHGKGLQKPSGHMFLLENRGADGGIDLSETRKKIEAWRLW